jgi:hypothetical protein
MRRNSSGPLNAKVFNVDLTTTLPSAAQINARSDFSQSGILLLK